MNKGIYILTNNAVYDQLIALLNSIEANYSKDIPICIIPYDDNIDLVKKEIAKRRNVSLFENEKAIKKYENFVAEIHKIYFSYSYTELPEKRTDARGVYRKWCPFDGPFDRFIFLDSDILIFRSLEHVFSKLDEYDFVAHDFQRTTSIRLKEDEHYLEVFKDIYKSTDNATRLIDRFHCSGFWASKKNLITEEDLKYFRKELENGDIKIFKDYMLEQSVLNYMTIKKNIPLYNFTWDKKSEYYTGVCATSYFEEKDHFLYDHGIKLTYLHYMGIRNKSLYTLCQLHRLHIPFKNILLDFVDKLFKEKQLKKQLLGIPYKDIFLYYRFIPRDN